MAKTYVVFVQDLSDNTLGDDVGLLLISVLQ